jgi:hypothetical protein
MLEYYFLQVGGWAWGQQPHTKKYCCYGTSREASEYIETMKTIQAKEYGLLLMTAVTHLTL